jgi:uncharacterized membrane protein
MVELFADREEGMGYEGDDDEGVPPRDVRRVEWRPVSGPSDAPAPDGASQDGTERSSGEEGVFTVAAAELFSGPIASPRTLSEYEHIVPGSARELIDCHLRAEAVAADAVERLSRAEAVSVGVGVIGGQVLTVGALIAAVVLLANGSTAGAIAAIVPGALGAAAQLVAAVRRRP